MKPSNRPWYWRTAGQITAGTITVGLIAAGCYPAHVNSGIPAFLFLLVVVTLSLSGSFAAAAVVSVVAVGCVDYFFIPPVLEWQITDPVDAVGLFTYWATSLVISRLASNAHVAAETAEKRRNEAALLYDAASQLLSHEPEMAGGMPSLRIFRQVLDLRAVCLFDSAAGTLLLEGQTLHDLEEETRKVYLTSRDHRDSTRDLDIRCLRVAGKLTGAIGFEGRLGDECVVGPLTLMAATALERARSFRDCANAAAVARTETLRSAILDAFAHEFKTPLAAMLAAAGGLRVGGRLRQADLELAELIESETSRLGRLTTRLLRMARLDRDEVKPNMELTDLRVLVTRVVKEYQSLVNDHSVTVTLSNEPAEVMSDPELLNLALVQVLDNAVKYSPPATTVHIELCRNNGLVEVFVTNCGGSIRPEYQEKIFDRFYRVPGTEDHVSSGTGLGLYIARKIVRAHSGALTLDRDHLSDQNTTTFRMTLPSVHHEFEHAS